MAKPADPHEGGTDAGGWQKNGGILYARNCGLKYRSQVYGANVGRLENITGDILAAMQMHCSATCLAEAT